MHYVTSSQQIVSGYSANLPACLCPVECRLPGEGGTPRRGTSRIELHTPPMQHLPSEPVDSAHSVRPVFGTPSRAGTRVCFTLHCRNRPMRCLPVPALPSWQASWRASWPPPMRDCLPQHLPACKATVTASRVRRRGPLAPHLHKACPAQHGRSTWHCSTQASMITRLRPHQHPHPPTPIPNRILPGRGAPAGPKRPWPATTAAAQSNTPDM